MCEVKKHEILTITEERLSTQSMSVNILHEWTLEIVINTIHSIYLPKRANKMGKYGNEKKVSEYS